MTKKSFFSVICVVLAATTCSATNDWQLKSDLRSRLAFNPMFGNSVSAVKSIDNSIGFWSANSITEFQSSIKEEDGFRHPSVTLEYGFIYNDDVTINGLDSDTHSMTLGLGFQTFWDIYMGGMITYNNTDGDAVGGFNSDTEGFVGTAYLSRGFYENWAIGASLSYGHAQTENGAMAAVGVRAGRPRTKTYISSYTFAPYISYYRTIDEWTFSITPSYQLTSQDFDYRTSGIINDDASMGTLVLMNSASYAFEEDISAGINLNWHQIVHEEHTNTSPGEIDRSWLEVGPNISYFPVEEIEMTANYSYAAFQKFFQNHAFNLGFTFYF